VEASLQHEAKATAHSVRLVFVLLKQRRLLVRRDIHRMHTGPVARDSPTVQRFLMLSRMEGERWQVARIWWRAVGGVRKDLTKNQSG